MQATKKDNVIPFVNPSVKPKEDRGGQRKDKDDGSPTEKNKALYGLHNVKPLNSTNMPRGTVPAKTVYVNMAIGMYQFHDLMANHGLYGSTTFEDFIKNHDSSGLIGMLNY